MAAALLAAVAVSGCGGGDPVSPLVEQTDRANLAALESDLRAAALGMETAFAETGSYPTVTAQIPGFVPSGGVQVTVARATADGFCLEGTVDGSDPMHVESSGALTAGPC
ncbi:MAG: hypothetical protein R2737_17510 [Candidatus Nanopelagicales bacterium]